MSSKPSVQSLFSLPNSLLRVCQKVIAIPLCIITNTHEEFCFSLSQNLFDFVPQGGNVVYHNYGPFKNTVSPLFNLLPKKKLSSLVVLYTTATFMNLLLRGKLQFLLHSRTAWNIITHVRALHPSIHYLVTTT